MSLFIDFSFAWISVILAFLLTVIYIIRNAGKLSGRLRILLSGTNGFLRKHHKLMGIMLIFTGLIHGLFSSESVFSFNLGTFSWVVSVLLGVNWMIRRKLSRFNGWMYYHRLITLMFLLSIVLHVVDVGGIQVFKLLSAPPKLEAVQANPEVNQGGTVTADNTKESTANSAVSENGKLTTGKFKDGTFTGEAQGYRPGLKVSVEIKNNTITDIKVTEHNEVNSRFYALPIQQIPKEIISKQSTDVDVISGASFTSTGIINAVTDALSKALISGQVPPMKQLPNNFRRR